VPCFPISIEAISNILRPFGPVDLAATGDTLINFMANDSTASQRLPDTVSEGAQSSRSR
jgi:hypothetical protein